MTGDMDYYYEMCASALDDVGVEVTDDQLKTITSAIMVGVDQLEELAHGHSSAHKDFKYDRIAHMCKACDGRGSILKREWNVMKGKWEGTYDDGS